MMFDLVYQSQKATETTVLMQQEMLQKWFGMFPGVPIFPTITMAKFQEFQKKWAVAVTETFKRRRETVEAQFKAGLENIERAFALGQAKTPEEARALVVELWKKCFKSLLEAYSLQMRDLQAGFEKWFKLTKMPI